MDAVSLQFFMLQKWGSLLEYIYIYCARLHLTRSVTFMIFHFETTSLFIIDHLHCIEVSGILCLPFINFYHSWRGGNPDRSIWKTLQRLDPTSSVSCIQSSSRGCLGNSASLELALTLQNIDLLTQNKAFWKSNCITQLSKSMFWCLQLMMYAFRMEMYNYHQGCLWQTWSESG